MVHEEIIPSNYKHLHDYGWTANMVMVAVGYDEVGNLSNVASAMFQSYIFRMKICTIIAIFVTVSSAYVNAQATPNLTRIEQAMDQGDDESAARIAQKYATGDGVPRDYAKASAWYGVADKRYKARSAQQEAAKSSDSSLAGSGYFSTEGRSDTLKAKPIEGAKATAQAERADGPTDLVVRNLASRYGKVASFIRGKALVSLGGSNIAAGSTIYPIRFDYDEYMFNYAKQVSELHRFQKTIYVYQNEFGEWSCSEPPQ